MTATRRDAEVAAMARTLIAAERDRREIPQFSDESRPGSTECLSGPTGLRPVENNDARRPTRRVQTGTDQQEQAACHGGGFAAVQAG